MLRRAALTVNTVNTVNTMFLFGAPYALHYPCGNFSPEPNQTAASKPTGYNKTCHGVAPKGAKTGPVGQRPDRYMAFLAKLFFSRELPTGFPGVVRGTTSPPDLMCTPKVGHN